MPNNNTISSKSVLTVVFALISTVLVLLGVFLMMFRPHAGEVIPPPMMWA